MSAARLHTRLRRIRRAPLLHFMLAGALLFGAHAVWSRSTDAARRAPIVVRAAELERGRREWALREGVQRAEVPTDGEVLDDAIDDAVLLREAQARAFDRRDPVVRARLLTLGRYLGLAAGDGDDAVEGEARALGLERSDEVLRRHLVEMMRLAAAKPGPSDLPNEAQLQAYYDSNRQRFAQPPRVALTHVYLSREGRGERLEDDASELLATLQRNATAPRTAAALGDAFVRGARMPPTSAAELDRTFGPGFAAAVADLPLRAWSGPIRSTYGLHLVWVESRLSSSTPPFAVVRNQLLHRYLSDMSATRASERLRDWRARYEIRVEQ